jgi:serine/threonine protein kinase
MHKPMPESSPPSQLGPAGVAVTTACGALEPGASPDDVMALPAGTRIAEFVITGLIGIGGFGIVYRAHDESLGRVVALKEYMPSSLAYRQDGHTVSVKSVRHADTFQAGLKSFVNESRMLALFDHPSLVKVYRFWEANGTAYMVMPLYEGQTLKKAMAELPGPPPEALLRQVLTPLLEALEIIHAKNCFHRDIAPDNIFLINTHQPVLLDFGAARQVIGDMANNLTVILKPGYAPIEQYAADPNLPQGAWTDIYALGAVLYHAITGRPPPVAVGRLVKDSYRPLASAGGTAYSQQLLCAVDRALAVRQTDRPQTVAEFRQLLGEPTAEPAVSQDKSATPKVPASAAKPGASATTQWVVIGGALAVLLGLGGYFFVAAGKAPAEPIAAATAVGTTPPVTAKPPQLQAPPGPIAAPASVAVAAAASAVAPVAVLAAPAVQPASTASATSTLPKVRATPAVAASAATATSAAAKPKPTPMVASKVPEAEFSTRPLATVTPVERTSETTAALKPEAGKPDWLTELRKRLASCEEKNILERVFCIERARRKFCEPDHWGKVDECRVSNTPVNEGRW